MVRPRPFLFVIVLVLAGAVTLSLAAQPAGPFKGQAELSGFQEVPTLTSAATGLLDLEISKDGDSVSYTLSYAGFTSDVRFAHIHLGRPAVNGGIMVFLCTNETPPTGIDPPDCPLRGGSVSGTVTSADVRAIANQNLPANAFDAFVDALRAEAGYANVHSVNFGGGEIRGQVTFSRADSINDN